MGWDSFGLPAENYAIKAGISPQESMGKIIPSYHTQYKAMGWSNDWEKEIATHLPEYYKWTQWLFIEMHKSGLAYQDSRMQWWCTKCQTVLANEQVIEGKCWRHDGADDPIVEKKEVKQWFFKITEYADELLDAIDALDWTESVKLAQKNWIGRSTGAEITFKIQDADKSIQVFTTRHDTQYGVTFLVLAPEHDLVNELTTDDHKTEMDEYIRAAQKKSEVERQASQDKDKTGVFTGSYAINPANNEPIPIWVADYVLAGYGTGGVMGVPGHDDRDHIFAQKYGLEIRKVLETDEDTDFHSEGIVINSDKYDGMRSEAMREEILRDFVESSVAVEKVNYKMRDWSVSRQRYWGAPIPIINCEQCGPVLVPDADLPVILPELDDFKPSGDGRSALARAKDWLVVECPQCGGEAERETDTLDTYICSSWYMLRYFDPHNQQAAFEPNRTKKWMPIDFYNGADHATAHLLYARFITRFFHKQGLVDDPEPFKQFLFNGKVTASDGTNFSKSKGNGVDPLEIIESGYGADALRMYLMFASPLELWTKWDPQGVPGTFRYLNRLWELVDSYTSGADVELSDEQSNSLKRTMHKMIKKVTDDLESNRYNTAIAALMGNLNDLYRLKSEAFGRHGDWQTALEAQVACVAPFAPHIAEELWQMLGHSMSVHHDSWPQWDEQLTQEDTMTVVVQINGKVRANIQLPANASEDEMVAAAKSDGKIKSYLDGKELRKTIVIARSHLINFVV